MKKILVCLFLFLGNIAYSQLRSPREIYPNLFEEIQMNKVYPDGKTFVDMIPLKNPDSISINFEKKKQEGNFRLGDFAAQNFFLPDLHTDEYHSDINRGLLHHIDTLWKVLYREPAQSLSGSSLLTLPKPYIVPGGRFREIYYWDSYFTMLGLQESGNITLMEDMVDNFAYLIRKLGFIPNGNRTYYLTRSQPPFFSQMVELLATTSNEQKKILIKYRAELVAEYDYWMRGADTLSLGSAAFNVVKLEDGTVLNRYWDYSDLPREESFREDVMEADKTTQPKTEFYRNIRAGAESGWDFSSRWFKDGQNLESIITTDLIAVDLNTLLYNLETNLSVAAYLEGDRSEAKDYQEKAERRKAAILKYLWNNQEQWFTDYNWKQKKSGTKLTLAGLYPLYFKIAKPKQVRSISKITRNKFLKSGGLITTLAYTGQQWDAPNGWAPLHWIAIKGFENYKYHTLSKTIAQRWINLNERIFLQTGKLMEKYNVEDDSLKAGGGEYPLQDGFGWTNGVLLKLLKTYGKD